MNADPKGYTFYDKASKRTMRLVYEDGPWNGWLLYKHPDGQWVSLRKATEEDWNAVGNAISKAHHALP